LVRRGLEVVDDLEHVLVDQERARSVNRHTGAVGNQLELLQVGEDDPDDGDREGGELVKLILESAR